MEPKELSNASGLVSYNIGIVADSLNVGFFDPLEGVPRIPLHTGSSSFLGGVFGASLSKPVME